MSKGARPHVPAAFWVGVPLGAVLGFAVARFVAGRSAAPASTRPISSGAQPRPATDPGDTLAPRLVSAGLEERLDRIEAQLTALGSASAPERRSFEPSVDGIGALQELTAAVGRLEAELRAHMEASEEHSPSQLQALREARPEPDWTALQAVLDAWTESAEAARAEVQLMSSTAVLQRFGSPTLIYTNERGSHWVYGQQYDPVQDSYALQVTFQLKDELVTTVWVE